MGLVLKQCVNLIFYLPVGQFFHEIILFPFVIDPAIAAVGIDYDAARL